MVNDNIPAVNVNRTEIVYNTILKTIDAVCGCADSAVITPMKTMEDLDNHTSVIKDIVESKIKKFVEERI